MLLLTLFHTLVFVIPGVSKLTEHRGPQTDVFSYRLSGQQIFVIYLIHSQKSDRLIFFPSSFTNGSK
jgi:hypothetical protein